MFLHVRKVEYLGGHRLRLEFSNGVMKEVDLTSELYGEVFEPLRDPELFKRVQVNPETGTIEWPTGADLAPEFLLEVGEEVEESPPKSGRPESRPPSRRERV